MKNKYYINTYMKSRKAVLMNLLQGKNREPERENRLVDTVAEGEERVRQTERALKLTLPSVSR